MKKQQMQMFEADEVLPLWTGTAMQGEVEVYRLRPAARQMGFGCPVCHDTGVVQVNGRTVRCTCPAGAKEVKHD
ncbi:MAG: hypothetical protein JXR84_13055 [Anaerolineae bacterium]|nr:hypothetical protein [Anaerolineae bacterium]